MNHSIDTQVNAFLETEIGPIPADWRLSTLGAIAELTMGQSPPSSTYNEEAVGLPFFQGKADFGLVYPTPTKWCSAPQRIAEPGSILVSLRAPVGDTNIAPSKCCIGRGLASITGNEGADTFYLFYQLQFAYERLEAEGTGSTFKGINKAVLYGFPIPLPSLAEQRRIAAVLSAIQDAIASQEDVIAAARTLKRSLMQRLFTYGPGCQPAETRETEIGEIPVGWAVVELGDVIAETQYGLNSRAELAGTYPVLRMNNLVDGRVDVSDLKYTELNEKNLERYRLQRGDVLFNRTNSYELVGKTAIFDLEDDYTFASYLVRVIPNSTALTPEFLNYCLNSDLTRPRLKSLATRGVSQSNISPTKLKRLVIGLPPIDEQNRAVSMIKSLDAKIAAEEDRKTALDALFRATLHQLMTGQMRLLSDEGLSLG